MKRSQLHEGDVFVIPLENYGYGAGIILHLSGYFKGAMMIGIFDMFKQHIEDIPVDTLSTFLEPPNYTSRQIITKGGCIIIGKRNDLIHDGNIPLLLAGNDIHFKDKIIDKNLLDGNTPIYDLLGMGLGAIQIRIARHFGLPFE